MASAAIANDTMAKSSAELAVPLNRTTSDYIEIFFLTVTIAIGIPINVHVFFKMLRLFVQSNRPFNIVSKSELVPD